MSESNGSTIFSDAGIQSGPAGVEKAKATLAIDFNGLAAHSDTLTEITFLIPTSAGGEHNSTATSIVINESVAAGSGPATTNKIGIGTSGGNTDANIAAFFIKAVNGDFSDSQVAAATGGETCVTVGAS